jgi:hypothetical protein
MPDFKGGSNLRICHDTAESIAERFRRPKASIDLETGTLTAKGVLWDKVQSVHFEEGIDGWSNAYPAPCKRILCWLMAAAQRCQHTYPTDISRLQAFARTFFANYQVDEFQVFALALTELSSICVEKNGSTSQEANSWEEILLGTFEISAG